MHFVVIVRLAALLALVTVLPLAGCGSGDGSDSSSPADLSCGGFPCDERNDQQPAPEVPLACGGFAGTSCPPDMACMDVAGDDCDPLQGGADCPGACVPHLGLPTQCGGLNGSTCAAGFICVADLSDGCEGGPAVDCPGVCEPERIAGCSADSECTVPSERCFQCADGTEICPVGVCADGQCIAVAPDCPAPDPLACGGLTGAACPNGFTCVDDSNDECDGGPAVDCPGICAETRGEECRADEDCPTLRVACTDCPDGSLSCPRSVCEAGVCRVDIRACPDPGFCGGIAGFTCPPGLVCIDAEGDDCDPADGGADCAGECVPEIYDGRCGGNDASTCLPHEECVDDPNDSCELARGDGNCPGFCQPYVEPVCESDAECPQIRIPCSVCPDGSEVCATSTCTHGACRIAFPACPPPQPCGQDGIGCAAGFVCADDPSDRCNALDDPNCVRSCIPEDGPRRCGGLIGEVCPPGYRCIDDPSDTCDPVNGADCGGVCAADETRECRSEADCPHILAPCAVCPDGSFACPRSFCEDGQCGVAVESCPDPGLCGGIAGFPCPDDHTCIDDPNDDCDPLHNGADCGGLCVPNEQVPPECSSDADCVQPAGPCRECPDGTFACPEAACVDGACRTDMRGC